MYQYVDDLLTAVPLDKVQNTLQMFNSFNPQLQFTVKVETDSSVPFLDTLVVRGLDNIVRLDWYRKSTSPGRYIPFSPYPYKQKINAVLALKNRRTRISHPDFLTKNLIKKKLLLENQYSIKLINKLPFNNHNINDRPDNNNNLPIEKKFAKLQFIHNLTPSLSRLFSG